MKNHPETPQPFTQDQKFRRRLVKEGIIVSIGIIGSGATLGLLGEALSSLSDNDKSAITIDKSKKTETYTPASIEEFVSLSEIVTHPQKYWSKETPIFLDIYKDPDTSIKLHYQSLEQKLLDKSIFPLKDDKTGLINKNPVYHGLLLSHNTNKEILWFSEDQQTLASMQSVTKGYLLENIRGKLVQMDHIPAKNSLAAEPTFVQGWAFQIINVLTKEKPMRHPSTKP
jgi:hypothetical protein